MLDVLYLLRIRSYHIWTNSKLLKPFSSQTSDWCFSTCVARFLKLLGHLDRTLWHSRYKDVARSFGFSWLFASQGKYLQNKLFALTGGAAAYFDGGARYLTSLRFYVQLGPFYLFCHPFYVHIHILILIM